MDVRSENSELFLDRETSLHRSSHRMIVIPALTDEICIDIYPELISESERKLYKEAEMEETDVDDSDMTPLLNEYVKSTEDKRELVSAIDTDLALEILGSIRGDLTYRWIVLLSI